MHRSLTRSVLATTLGAFLLAGMPTASSGAMIDTAQALSARGTEARAATLARVQAGLSRADVRAQLVRLGVDPADAGARAAALSDQDLTRLADRLDTLPAGGDAGIFVVLGVVFLVLLVLDYIGVIHVFNTHRR